MTEQQLQHKQKVINNIYSTQCKDEYCGGITLLTTMITKDK